MSLLDKLKPLTDRLHAFGDAAVPFGSNNSFGLTFHPDVIAAVRGAVERFGSGTTGSRVANGTLRLHRDLERELADFDGKREALVFTTGYQANLGVIGGLCGADDVVLLDV